MSTPRSVVLLGAGGFAAEVADAILAAARVELVGFFDDNPVVSGKRFGRAGYFGAIAEYLAGHSPEADYFIAMGDNRRRASLDQALRAAGRTAAAVVHPSTDISATAKVAAGTYVGTGCFIGPDVVLGRCSLINVHSSVGHDAILGDYAQLCPGVRVSGGCRVAEGAFLGSNAVLAPRGAIGPWARLGAASFATHVPAECLAMGVPARIVSRPATPPAT